MACTRAFPIVVNAWQRLRVFRAKRQIPVSMILRSTLALLAIALVPVVDIAQVASDSTPISLSEYQKQEWHVEDGLPQGNVRAITQAPDRSLMIATSEGIASFDGAHFAAFPLRTSAGTNEPVNAILFSRSGDLWIGTDDRGVLLQRGKDLISISEDNGFHSERIRALYQDRQGDIWAATQNGIERIHNGKIQAFYSLGLVSGDLTRPFAEDGFGKLFVLTSKGVFLWNGEAMAEFPLRHSKLGAATAAFGDGQGTVWLGLTRGFLKLTVGAKGDYLRKEIPSVHGFVTALVEDRRGCLWAGTKGTGIFRISPFGKIAAWTSRDGLADDTIRSLYTDDEGNLWIGLLSGGLTRWRNAPLLPFGQPEGFAATYAANVLGDRRGDLWLGSWGSGLWRIHNGELRKEHLSGMPDDAHIRALSEDEQGNIWIGSWFYGIYRFDGRAFRHFLTGNESLANAVSVLRKDNRGSLWVGTYKGLIRYSSGVPEKKAEEVFLPGKLVTSITQDTDHSMVVGTFDGLYRIRESRLESITQKDGLSNPFILSVSQDDSGAIWVGTKAGGLDLVVGGRAIHIGSKTGLPDYPVFSVLDDGEGNLWLSTTRGLLKVPRGQLLAAGQGGRHSLDTVLYGRNDGMRSSESGGQSQPHATRTRNGELWFTTAKGFVHTAPSRELAGVPPLAPHITEVSGGKNPVSSAGQVVLRSGASDLEISYNAIRLGNPAQVQFRHKLEGYDRDWTITESRQVHYKNLPPGNYRFLLSARDAGQAWNDSEQSLNVVQRPFFFQTFWFYLLTGVSAAALFFALLRWRELQIRARMKLVVEERNRIAREWHDTLMAGLAAISWQLEATVGLFDRREKGAEQSLQLARNMVRHCQAEGRRIIWDLQHGESPVGALSEALGVALAKIQPRPSVDTKISVRGSEIPLSPVAIHHLVCICQEAVSNALRHGDASSVQIALQYGDAAMTVSVIDDGRGFQPRQPGVPGHFGLSVMEERARKIGGNFRIDSALGAGTQVSVELPVGSEGVPA